MVQVSIPEEAICPFTYAIAFGNARRKTMIDITLQNIYYRNILLWLSFFSGCLIKRKKLKLLCLCRVARTLMYMLFLIHIESCGYYAMSAYEGLNRNEWVYSGEGIA